MATTDLGKLKIDRTTAKPKRRRRMWPYVLGILALLVVAGLVLSPHKESVTAVSVVTRYPSQQYIVLNASGYVVAQRKAAVGTKATGRLEWLGVQEGSIVKKNDLLARLDARDVNAQLDSANANLGVANAALAAAEADARDAEDTLKRTKDLADRHFVSPSAVVDAQAKRDRAAATIANAHAAIRAAQANERNAKVSVDFTEIRAPFDGVVVSKSANVGDIVTAFSSAVDSKGAVVSMADLSTLEVEADVSESSIGKITVAQPVEILLDALPDERFTGTVSRTVPTVDRAKATVTTKVAFDKLDPRILPDMSAKVSFLSRKVSAADQKPLLAVAPDAVVERDGHKMVFRIKTTGDASTAEAIEITGGTKFGDMVEIAAPGKLQSGDKLVAKPSDKLRDGMALSLQAK